MILEIIQGDEDVKEIRNANREIMGLSQTCYFHLPGSAFPVKGKIRVKQRQNPGKYSFEPEFRTGKFGDLEVNPFVEPELKPARPEQLKAASA